MLKNPFIPCLALAALAPFAVWAQAPAPVPASAVPAINPTNSTLEPPAEPPSEAEKILDEALKKVAALKSVTTDIAQKVEMLGQKFGIQGRYLRAPENRIYLKLSISGLADSSGTTLQFCDGQTLWDYQQVLEGQVYRKVSKIPQILEKLNSTDLDAKIREQILTQYLRLSGPDALLSGLRKSIRFDQKEEATLDGKPVWVLHGLWKSREGLIGPDQRPLPPTAPLPAYIPSVVTVWIGKEDGWPYKILFLGKVPTILEDNRPLGPDGKRIGAIRTVQKVQPSRVELDYSNVRLNPPWKPEEFAFQAPPDARVQDETDVILTGLDQALQAGIAKKKAATGGAGEDNAILKQAIEVPKPPTP